MTPERFAALIEAYGGRPERWPDAERAAACAFVQAHPAAADAQARALTLDAALAAWTVPGPGAALAGRLATINQARGRRRWWWSGIGAAAALASGLAAGAIAVEAATPPPSAAPLYGLSVLGAPLQIEAPDTTRGPA